MLEFLVETSEAKRKILHDAGPYEFGRGPEGEVPRCVVQDPMVSRDQLRVEEFSGGRIRVDNLSRTNVVFLADGTCLPINSRRELQLPLRLVIGKTCIDISRPASAVETDEAGRSQHRPVARSAASHGPSPGKMFAPGSTAPLPVPNARAQPARDHLSRPEDSGASAAEPFPHSESASGQSTSVGGRPASPADLQPDWPKSLLDTVQPVINQPVTNLYDLGKSPSAHAVAQWLERVLELHRSTDDLNDLYESTCRCLVEMVGMEAGMVLLRNGNGWDVAARYDGDNGSFVSLSRTLLDYIVREKRTFYQGCQDFRQTESLVQISAAVVSPIFDPQGNIVGALYGARSVGRRSISQLEAQIVQLLAGVASTRRTEDEAARTRVQFEQFFSPELVRELQNNPDLLEGREQEVTILVSDLRGSSGIADRLGPQQTCLLIRDTMEHFTQCIIEEGGVVVDYAGDGILAMWNAPVSQVDHAARACRAALGMQRALPELNARWKEVVGRPLEIGVGINTGQALVGNTGSIRKLKYGPHGQTVNLASRVENATKRLGVPLLITGSSQAELPDDFTLRRLCTARLRGIEEPVVLYELHSNDPSPEWLHLRDVYEKALAQFELGQWCEACQDLLSVVRSGEEADEYDVPTINLLRTVWQTLENRPGTPDPVLVLS